MIGKTISHYRVLEKLGGGGMGVVYEAEDINLGRRVALKVLPEDFSKDSTALERFQREARAAASLSHPAICTIHEVDEHEGTPFIVMELLEGRTLRQLIADGPLPIARIVRFGLEIAEALAAAHAKGLTHRDIKPSNIFVTRDGKLKIVDFGLAKLTGGPAEDQEITLAVDAPTQTADVTADGTAPGTVAYMSPEQALGHKLDTRTDLFSLGAVLYEMTTGRRAFSGPTEAAVFDHILNRPPESPSQHRDDLPVGLLQILRNCLEKDRQLRYQSAMELHTDLQRLKRDLNLESTSTTAAAPAPTAESWSSATTPSARAARSVWKRPATILGTLAVLAIVAALWLARSQEPSLQEADEVLLTDLTNTTGDPVFDGTLKQALAVKLGESPYLKVFPERGVHETLRFMNLSADERVTPELGQEICERRGLEAVITGEIAALGSNYVVTLNALECRSGRRLAGAQVEIASKEEVLAALGNAAADLRMQLGESLSSIERFDAPVEQATTTSLEALKTFALGEEQRDLGNERESMVFYERAIELDPEFALAHARLGQIYMNIGDIGQGIEYKRRAYELRDRVSERERLYITAHFYGDVTGERAKEIQTYELWQRTYPHDSTPYNNMAWRYNDLGQSEKALAPALESRRLAPDSVFPYSALGTAYLRLGRFDDARSLFDDALGRGFVSNDILRGRHQIAFLEGDQATMERLATSSAGTPWESRLLELQATAKAAAGQPTAARRLFAQAAELAGNSGLPELEALHTATAALSEALLGFSQLAVEQSLAAIEIAHDPNTLHYAAIAFALAQEPNQAQALIDEMDRRFPAHTLVQAVYLANARAALQLRLGDSDMALKELRSGAPYEAANLETLYLRGLAYLASGRSESAAAEFTKIVKLEGVQSTSPIHTLARLGLARAHVAAGKTELAREAFEEFFRLVSDAEDGVPVIERARRESELQS